MHLYKIQKKKKNKTGRKNSYVINCLKQKMGMYNIRQILNQSSEVSENLIYW